MGNGQWAMGNGQWAMGNAYGRKDYIAKFSFVERSQYCFDKSFFALHGPCPMPHALCPMPYALCPMPHAPYHTFLAKNMLS
jgi:hypothetical protein